MSPGSLRRIQARWRSRPGAQALAEARAEHHRTLRKLAHDLRNPLNSILLMAQLLEETAGSPDVARIAGRIQKQCLEMNGMVDKALESAPE
ncbi:histidine kinase dimerization/phospho-acceptor domain-containing protein [Mesoterricola silvestris]|uniref:histidine kinase n=1 Tax=Mesoterricola silvestris TaxID=2927979 RepID=A0AA48GUK3_9BACT|nr:histidine kinase dimerization/phospho-acceptor domain-containing protein [Mesoterricola silvestris]BDU72061.1 hypothetical protein METEAL_12350 [Mesoterricola silvestris]